MEKRKKWQLYLIVAVAVLTIYNILPTVFYYSKPLREPINEAKATEIAQDITERVNRLEGETKEWLNAFCKLIKVKPLSVGFDPKQPSFFTLSFKNAEDASLFRKYLPRAGALIPFVPAQLSLYDPQDTMGKNVVVQREIPIHFDQKELPSYTQFSEKLDSQGTPTPLYRALIDDRALQVGISLAGPSQAGEILQGLKREAADQPTQDILTNLCQEILSFVKVYGEESGVAKRYFATFSQVDTPDRSLLIQNFLRSLEQMQSELKREKGGLESESDRLRTQGSFLEVIKQQRLEFLTAREKTLSQALAIVKRNLSVFASGQAPMSYVSLGSLLHQTAKEKVQILPLAGCNPFIQSLAIDWNNEKIFLTLHPDAKATRDRLEMNPSHGYLKDLSDQLLYNEIATASRHSGEKISPFQDKFEIELNTLTNSKSFLALRLSSIANVECSQLKEVLSATWKPEHPDLTPESFPIYDYETFSQLPSNDQALCLFVYSPALAKKAPPRGFRMNSIYVVAKGMDKILQRVQNEPQSPQTKQFIHDFTRLRTLLGQNGFVGYSGSSFGLSAEFSQDFVFEREDYYQNVLAASRENFSVHGTKRYGILEFTDVEQRLLAQNKIDNAIHEDLLKARDDYTAAQLSIKGVSKFDVPKPTQNAFWDNFKLSFVKYFRGDDRKILRWGLDLSGGKTVQIELRDHNNRQVTNEADVAQGINELYSRVNKMGVSEVSIRREGNFITLDFPGSQGLSAKDLVKASSMYFHVVNEKFGPNNPLLADAANHFLQEVWNEAVVTNRKEADEINLIAWRHLHGDSMDPDVLQPRSEAARFLYEQGLRLSHPYESVAAALSMRPIQRSLFLEEAISPIGTTKPIPLFSSSAILHWKGQT